ncbi:MAG: AsmA family protein [Acidobacteriota bacterium]
MGVPRRKRWTAAAIVAAGLAIAAAGVALPALLDVDRYRPLIVRELGEATGRSIDLGALSLRLLPVPAIRAERLAVSEGPRYPDREALRARSVSIRVALLPLLKRRLVIRSIVLDRPIVNLIRDAEGRWSFDDLLDRADASGRPGPPRPSGGERGLRVAVHRAVVRSGRLRIYDDAVVPGTRSSAQIGPIGAAVRGWGAGGATEVDLSVRLGSGRLKAEARLEVDGSALRLRAAVAGRGLRASDLAGLSPWLGVAQPDGLEVAGEIDLEGELTLPLDRPEAAEFEGEVRLRDLSYRDASMSLPVQGIRGTLAVDGNRAVWRNFGLRIGSSSIGGRLRLEDFERPRVAFDLASPNLDFNEILDGLAGPASATDRVERGGSLAAPAAAGEGPGLLQRITARGTLSADRVRFQTFELTDVKASGGLARGALTVDEMRTSFYGGTLGGRARVDLGGGEPAYGLDARLDGVEVEPLLAAYDPALSGLLRGNLSGSLEVEASGSSLRVMLANARGTGSLELSGGSLTSFSVLKRAAALLEAAGGRGIGRDETAFEYLRGTLSIAEGVASTRDLVLHSPDLDLFGRGGLGLDGTLDLRVAATFSEGSSRGMVERSAKLDALTDEQGRVTLHLLVRGPLASPRISLDTSAQARQFRDRKKKEFGPRARKRLMDLLLESLGERGEEE